MTNHQKRLERISTALDAAGLKYSLCNDLLGLTKTTLYVQTSTGQLDITIQQPGLRRSAFRLHVEKGELIMDPPTDVLPTEDRRNGFTVDFDIDQTDLLAMIHKLKPYYRDNVTDIREPLKR